MSEVKVIKIRTEEEVAKQIQSDKEFLISAVTDELKDLAYLFHFEAWENNGGMQWFYDECVQITNEVMFEDGSPYQKWLEHWKTTEDKQCQGFSEFTDETCFDWYHMNRAREIFLLRTDKDDIETTKGQVSERIGMLLSHFKEDMISEVTQMGLLECNKLLKAKAEREEAERKKKEEAEQKAQRVQAVVEMLRAMEVDGDTMEQILHSVGMDEQMYNQLNMTFGTPIEPIVQK